MRVLRSVASMLWPLILAWNAVSGVEFHNKIEADPVVACEQGRLSLRVPSTTTGQPPSRVFVKGHSESSACAFASAFEASFRLDDCDMRRQRQLNPRGMSYSLTVVVQMHPLFVTKVDRAYNIKCFYMEADKIVTNSFDVSMLTTATLDAGSAMPACRYTIHRETQNGPIVRYAEVGDKVYHVWECPSDAYSMLVHSCYVEDGQGNRIQILDAAGCGTDEYVLRTPDYNGAGTVAAQESHVFKFADRIGVRFNCQVRLCHNEGGGCDGITVTSLTDKYVLRMPDYNGAGTVAAQESHVFKFADRIGVRFNCQVRLCHNEGGGCDGITVTSLTDKYVLRTPDYNGAGTVAAQESHVFKFADRIGVRFNCQVRLCHNEGGGCDGITVTSLTDKYVLRTPDYNGAGTVAAQESHVFKFADRIGVRFNCQVRLCHNEGGGCDGITVTSLTDKYVLRTPDYNGAGTVAAQESHVFKFADRIGVRFNCQVRLCHNEGGGCDGITVTSLTDKYVLRTPDYNGAGTVAAQESHVFKFADRIGVRFNCQVRLCHNEGGGCDGITVTSLTDKYVLRTPDYNGAGTVAAQESHVFKFADRIGVRFNCQVRLCHNEGGGCDGITVTSLTDKYVLRTPDYNGAGTVAAQESHVFKFADRIGVRFNCQVRLCHNEGGGCDGITVTSLTDKYVLRTPDYNGAGTVAAQESHVFKFADRIGVRFNCQVRLCHNEGGGCDGNTTSTSSAVAAQESHVFKFADRIGVRFNCQVRLCHNEGGGCDGNTITVTSLTDKYVLRTPDYNGAGTVAAQESHVFKFADRIGVRFNCQVRLCHNEGGGCDGITVTSLTDKYVLRTPDYNGAGTVAAQESHVFKFADRIGVRFNCQVRLCHNEGGGCDGNTPPRCADGGGGNLSGNGGVPLPISPPSGPNEDAGPSTSPPEQESFGPEYTPPPYDSTIVYTDGTTLPIPTGTDDGGLFPEFGSSPTPPNRESTAENEFLPQYDPPSGARSNQALLESTPETLEGSGETAFPLPSPFPDNRPRQRDAAALDEDEHLFRRALQQELFRGQEARFEAHNLELDLEQEMLVLEPDDGAGLPKFLGEREADNGGLHTLREQAPPAGKVCLSTMGLGLMLTAFVVLTITGLAALAILVCRKGTTPAGFLAPGSRYPTAGDISCASSESGAGMGSWGSSAPVWPRNARQGRHY